MDHIESVHQTREELDKISKSFCLAKWLQVTVHLQNGFTHSCHHPIPHKISLDELKENPTALHNTKFKKEQRRCMKSGDRPPECDYCWNIEDLGKDQISDRHLKSQEGWALPELQNVVNAPWDNDVTPTYMEVSFSHVCNFKCAYCAPNISSKWMEEIKKFGPYPTRNFYNNIHDWDKKERTPIPVDAPNPYTDAFWKWWPTLYPKLKVFRITGGEPLLTENTFRVLKYVNENPRPDLELALNSNLGVPFKLIEKCADAIEPIIENNKVKHFALFTSVDTFGKQAEYIRYGLQYDKFLENIEYLLGRLPKLQIVIMCTYNALSVPQFHLFLEDVARLKDKYGAESRFLLDIPYVRNPDFMSAKILSDDLICQMTKTYNFMESISEKRFNPVELLKMKRLVEWASSPKDPAWLKIVRRDFANFFTEYDRRRGTHFLETFPEMHNFWNECLKELS